MDNRANPDELLSYATEQEEKAKRGKLKIFFGASPGVGKTYAMLQDAIQKHAEGLDVLVGIVESHGRGETQNLLDQLPQLPRMKIDYRGKKLHEFDLDAAIARHPGLLLVDEMAHTNAPTCRHNKRWQDIKELIERGIDVYTTLNVQHIESLNDVVAQITGVRVRETVPDSMLEMVDNIELIDLPPEDLLTRLHEGKVYLPEQAKLAVDQFFRKSNLVALRELALRVTAQQVNTELLTERRWQGENVWPTAERLLVCVGPGQGSTKLVRAARRLATKLQAQWHAVYVKSPQSKLSADAEKSALSNLRLAEELGAQTSILSENDFVLAIVNYARLNNVSTIVIAKQVRPRWKDILFGSLVDELVRNSGELDIYVVQQDSLETTYQTPRHNDRLRAPFKSYLVSIFYVLLGTLLAFVLYPFINKINLFMIYLLTVIVISMRGEHAPALVASVLSILIYDYCFIPPRYSFSIDDSQYFITLIVLLFVAQVISHLTTVTKWQIRSARSREARTSQLLGLSRQLAEHRGTEKLIKSAIAYMADVFHARVSVLLPDQHNNLHLAGSSTPETTADDKELSIAQWTFDLKQMAGIGTETLTDSDALYVPLIALEKVIGVLVLRPSEQKQFLLPENMHALESCTQQIALALDVETRQQAVSKSP